MALKYTIGKVNKHGQYKVKINLNEWMDAKQKEKFAKNFNKFSTSDPDFQKVFCFKDPILKYKSESLFPKVKNSTKKKVMIIAGNPATHSVAKGMFFYSKVNGEKHNFWGKLEKEKIIEKIDYGDRKKEADERKKRILDGTLSDKYLLGLTTFYSFPTEAKRGVKGVERLFQDVLSQLQNIEYQRLVSYPFSQNAIWVFIQNSSYSYVKSMRRTEHWPLKGKGSGGKDLLRIL